ncbi:hypothetical protein J6Z19_08455 [bacterium]|nr:hypothetical protein [bacterium]
MIMRNLKQFCFINFIAKYKILTMILFSLIIICTVIFAIFYDDDIRIFYCNNQGAIISTFGAIVGAIVGGLLSLGGSLIISDYEQKKANAIRRKNEIYKPLYEELQASHERLTSNPYPTFIAFKEIQQNETSRCPQYIEWEKVKHDIRFFEVPQDLKNAMEDLHNDIKIYEQQRDLAASILSRIYEEETRNYTICDIDSLLPGVLLDECPLSITSNLWEQIKRANIEPDLNKCKKARSDWYMAEKNALKLLDKLIKGIVDKYEK